MKCPNCRNEVKIDAKEFWDFVDKEAKKFEKMSPEMKEQMRLGSFDVYRACLDIRSPAIETHGKDTEKQVFFYENDFYVLSNFSSFAIWWKGLLFPTSEHVYHWEKFDDPRIKEKIRNALSAHEALKIAHANKNKYRKDWYDDDTDGRPVRVNTMKPILKAKAMQHEYVRRKVLETGDRELVEDSWRDDFWGWGPNKNGQNWMGRLWMELREEWKKGK